MSSKLTCIALATLCLCATAVAVLAQDDKPAEVRRLEVPEDFAAMKAPDLKDADRIEQGKNLYNDPAKANCAMCHGAGGKGDGLQAPNYSDPAVSDLTDATFQDAVTDQYIYWRIKEVAASKAYPNSGMLGYQNGTEEELWAIVAFVRSLKAAATEEVKVLTKEEFADLMTDIKTSWNALQKATKARDADKATAEAEALEGHARKILGNDNKTADGKLVRKQDDFKKFAEDFRKAAEDYAKLVKAADWEKAADRQVEIGDGCANCHDVYKPKKR